MDRYVVSFPKVDEITDWTALAEPFGDRITIIYEFPSGSGYLEMTEETKEEFIKAHPEARYEKIAKY